MMNQLSAKLAMICAMALVCEGCGDDDDVGERTGQSCQSAEQCFPEVQAALQGGDAVCMDRVPGGYCTHHCTADTDCCAVPGECLTDFPQVCGPFESTGQMYCFLSCESSDLAAVGFDDENAFCGHYAHASFRCRSTGGGAANRKVCVP